MDYDTSVFALVTITANPADASSVNAATTSTRNTVAMQNTGVPLVGMILALLLLIGGLGSARKI